MKVFNNLQSVAVGAMKTDKLHKQRMNQTGITCRFYRKGCAGLKGCMPAGYPSR
jgi:hypothetical protein